MKKEFVRLIFGLKVRQLRQEKNLSFKELADETQLSVSYLNEIEKGKKFPKTDKILKLAEVLGVSYDQLVSLKLNKKLAPISVLIQSGILDNLPLEVFGLEASTVLELIAEAPTQVNAFISTLLKIARNYELTQEGFYLAALRSYQEMHDNYFEDLEESAREFSKKHNLGGPLPIEPARLEAVLQSRFGIRTSPLPASQYPALQSLRSVFDPANKVIYLHPELTPSQRSFQLGRELAFQHFDMKARPLEAVPIQMKQFDEVLNNFKASYFGVCLTMPRESVLEDIRQWFAQPTWDSAYFLQFLAKYDATSEMFLHRLINLLPRYFNLDQLFFLRFSDDLRKNRDNFAITKELHLSRLHNPHRNDVDEHYCRRWVSIRILEHLKMDPSPSIPRVDVQKSSYVGSKSEYFCISLAQKGSMNAGANISVTLGILVDSNSRRKIKFLDDPAIPARVVSETCERCTLLDCAERAAPPVHIAQQERIHRLTEQVEALKRQQPLTVG